MRLSYFAPPALAVRHKGGGEEKKKKCIPSKRNLIYIIKKYSTSFTHFKHIFFFDFRKNLRD